MRPHGRMARLRGLRAYKATSVCRCRISMSAVCCRASGSLHAPRSPPAPGVCIWARGSESRPGRGVMRGGAPTGGASRGRGPGSAGAEAGVAAQEQRASGQRTPSAPSPVARDAALDGAGPRPEPAAGAGEERRGAR